LKDGLGGKVLQERQLDVRDPADRDVLISEWLHYAESGDKSLFWAYDAVADLIDDDPCLAWTIILEILHRAHSEGTFSLAAAGPLEDLIAFHGRNLIDRIEQQADGDETLRRALFGVWLSPRDLDPTILKRYARLGVTQIV
jgi:Family of unknown function (DUF6869)